MILIGLTGGIGSGKSTVSARLAELGARVIVVRDGERHVGLLADLAREVVRIDASAFRPPPAVVAEQSAGFVDGVAQAGERLVLRIDVSKVVGNEAIPEVRDGTQA